MQKVHYAVVFYKYFINILIWHMHHVRCSFFSVKNEYLPINSLEPPSRIISNASFFANSKRFEQMVKV